MFLGICWPKQMVMKAVFLLHCTINCTRTYCLKYLRFNVENIKTEQVSSNKSQNKLVEKYNYAVSY